MASMGQPTAQTPHPKQRSGSMMGRFSGMVMALAGHLPMQVSQPVHSSGSIWGW
jgi:hypothetical protein